MAATDHDEVDSVLAALRERAKELECLYAVEDALSDPSEQLDVILERVIQAVAQAMLYPEISRARIVVGRTTHESPDLRETPWRLSAKIRKTGEEVGELSVFYLEERPPVDDGPFLREEVRLVRAVADRIGLRLEKEAGGTQDEGLQALSLSWRSSLALLRATDRALYMRAVRKLINHMCGIGNREAQGLLAYEASTAGVPGEVNEPGRRVDLVDALVLSAKPLELASRVLSDDELLFLVQKWIREDKASGPLKIPDRASSTHSEVADALRRFGELSSDSESISQNVVNGVRTALIRRVLTEQLEYIHVAKNELEPSDFEALFDRLVVPAESHGKVGGKGAGLFLAQRIIERVVAQDPTLPQVRVPKTWHVASDGIKAFIRYNDLEDVLEQKYKPIEQVRQEYPNIVQLFKHSRFPPELVQGLSVALDDFGEGPIIVRSSSLLEDRMATAFSGKYKSLFLANRGTKRERLDALLDAIAEIYASVFSPDPIEYRRDRGLLDFNEEMGILVQEVVGRLAGDYFLPAFAGVAFSKNELRWSPRIKRDDGLVRLVPGLGTRAVDRVADDFPTLAVPGQPSLRVNTSVDEIIRYSPRKADVLNVRRRCFQTKDIKDLLGELGTDFPGFESIFSSFDGDRLTPASRLLSDPDSVTLVVTFEALLTRSSFLERVRRYLQVLEERLGTPVDIEFAHDGEDFYLLQCRPQSHSDDSLPATIPKDLPSSDVLFGASKHVSNGWVPEITHIVYVDPERYAELPTREDLVAVGRAVGRLNKLLPKRQFILMGPGRWGSRGDITLGVPVTYSDISNTAMLIEIARRRGNYLPDLSFGTHFFQDLVEAHIRYLPLYPDEQEAPFNEHFFRTAPSVLLDLLPDCERVADCLRVIDVPETSGGRILRVHQNAELDEAVAFLAHRRDDGVEPEGARVPRSGCHTPAEDHWTWRLRMAERVGAGIDPDRFGVVACYVFGSTKNATAGPGSDIDLLLHIRSSDEQRRELEAWLEGWSRCLAEMNFLRTGYRSSGLLDVHFVTDADIAARSSFAVKIGAVTDAARLLPLRKPD